LASSPDQNNFPIFKRKRFLFRCRDFQIPLGDATKIMGIVNITPDSFSQDGCLKNPADFTTRAVSKARRQIKSGADFIDIGGESSRPGAKRISAQEEIARVIPTVQRLTRTVSVPISIDTYKPLVARHALDAGAAIINNIMGTTPDRALLKMVQRYDAGLILMHMPGTPRTMQRHVHYQNIIDDISRLLQKSLEICLEIGIKSDRIMLDPGIGFGKTVEQNLLIINRLAEFSRLDCPILVGTSRKSFIGKILNQTVNRRTWGTAASVTASILRGAHVTRVHDVREMKETVLVGDAILNQTETN